MGLYDTSTKKGTVVSIVESETLLDVIVKHVKSGTKTWTDC